MWPDPGGDLDVDVALVGAGGAGLSVLVELDRLLDGAPGPRVALIDPEHRRGADRTWCYWTAAAPADRPAATREWREVDVVDPSGRVRVLDLDPLRYVMVPSASYYALAERARQRLRAVRVTASAEHVRDGAGYAVVHAAGRQIRARYVFDSRPAPPARLPRTALVQHFRGWTVRFPSERETPGRAVLMDFRATQPVPGPGLGFGYVLPLDARRALVEYTQFSRAPLSGPGYDAALRGYLALRWPDVAGQVQVEAVESGVIPMTDGVYPRRTGRRVFRLGTAGGATRGSTGYTFAAMQRQARAVAGALVAGRDPLPPPAYPRRHRWMDAVLLRALDGGFTAGPDLLVRLLERNPTTRILRFLDGTTSPAQDLAVMATAPPGAMARAAAVDAAARLLRRVH